MTDPEKLARICDDIRQGLSHSVGEWQCNEWAQLFAEGLLARGVKAPQ